MAYRYLSQEWVDEAKERINSNPEIAAKGKDVSKRMRLIATDCPGNTDILFDMSFQEGKIADVHREEKPAPSDFRDLPYDKDRYFLSMMPSYENTYKVTSGKFGVLEAIKAREYHVQGSKWSLTAFAIKKKKFINALTKTMNEIPTEL
jgi:hypothetical protein